MLQVVRHISERTGASFALAGVTNPNGHGDQKNGGVENLCNMASVKRMYNERALYQMGTQFAMDVISFGYI
jgi:hypothetical protein